MHRYQKCIDSTGSREGLGCVEMTPTVNLSEKCKSIEKLMLKFWAIFRELLIARDGRNYSAGQGHGLDGHFERDGAILEEKSKDIRDFIVYMLW